MPESKLRRSAWRDVAAADGAARTAPVSPIAADAGVLRPRSVRDLASLYKKAVKKSRELGKPVRLTMDVADRSVARRPARNDAIAAALARGETRVAAILGGKDMLSADEFARLLGVSRVTINDWRQKRLVLALEGAKRGYRFPDWQVGADGKPFAALSRLFKALGDSPWAVYRFLVQHHPELEGMTGRDALRSGHTTDAIEAAEILVGTAG